MHANEALNARAELKNKEVTSLTSLREPELCRWVSALKAAQHVGRNWRCHLMVHAYAQTSQSCCSRPLPLPGPSYLRKYKAPEENQDEL